MVTIAPRISRRLVDAIVRFDDQSRPIAEIYRRVGAEAERLGLTRPSYQRVRELVHEARSRQRRRPTIADFLELSLAANSGNPHRFIDAMRAVGIKPLPLWFESDEPPSAPRPP